MADLLLQVRQYVRRYGLLAQGETAVAGVSGGPDSLCMLHLLRSLAPEIDLKLHVAHLNHGLRGADSDADADFVAELARGWALPYTVGKADVLGLATMPGVSVEEAARLARYRFLAELADATGASVVVVGHNADDQAETVLMHFVRGSGAAGLRGMLPSARLADYRLGVPVSPVLRLVRPLLCVPRAETEAYCAEHGLTPRRDRSNEDVTIYRNRLRHELLPILTAYNPGVREALARTAEVMGGDYETLRDALDAVWAEVTVPSGPEEIRFDLARWRALSLGLQRATVREAIWRLRRDLRNLGWEHVERAVWLAREGQTGQSATLMGGLALQIDYRSLRIGPEALLRGVNLPLSGGDVPQIEAPVHLRAPGVTPLSHGWQVVVRWLGRGELPPSGGYTAERDPWSGWLDAGVVGPNLVLRARVAGDRFQPQGLGGHSTALGEFMINAKVPRSARATWPLLAGRTGLVWICGLRVDERAIVRPDTTAVWHVQFVRGEG